MQNDGSIYMNEPSCQTASAGIIFVEKDDIIRRMIAMAMGDQFQILTAGSAEEALLLLQAEPGIRIVISGLTLSGMNGLEFLRRTGELYPDTVRVLTTGGLADTDELKQALVKGHIDRILQKPYCITTLKELFMKASNAHHSQRLPE